MHQDHHLLQQDLNCIIQLLEVQNNGMADEPEHQQMCYTYLL